ncbi:hypothetical protein [Undibacterium sp. GrIS 1.8]|uniref:hypothetical protein n=1 Tax=Undibacterium sp. GrIS 1.8 TaxID=3143934 RepID=UPI00339B0E78
MTFTHMEKVDLFLGQLLIWHEKITPEVIANQQRVADIFTQLKLIPKTIKVSDKVWNWKPAK